MVTLLTLIMVVLVPICGPQFGIGAGGPGGGELLLGRAHVGSAEDWFSFSFS
jgi:hypothetical protein